MADITQIVAGSRWTIWRLILWGIAAFLLLLPAVAMQFTPEVNWTASDFVVMGAILATACGACELAARASDSGAYRMGAGFAVLAAFLTVWVNLAVGMIGSEGNPYNLAFAGVIGLALVGGVLAGFRADGMARAMLVAALAQALAAGIGTFTDLRGGILSAMFALPWLLSAALFRKAADEAR